MIGRLRGTLAWQEGTSVIVDVAGVGYRVMAPVSALAEIGPVESPVTLYTHLVVREDELSLYGFLTPDDVKAFETLIGVSGIGPKVALAILSTMDVATLAHAVAVEDTRTLVKVPGLGLKTAQRLVLELKEKMAALALTTPGAAAGAPGKPAAAGSPAQFEADIVEALAGLGYNRKDAERAAARVVKETPPGEPMTSAKALRAALNVLTGNR